MTSSINSITEADVETFECHGDFFHYQSISSKSAIYPGKGMPVGLMYTALKLNGEAGELAEHVGKAMRGDAYGVSYDDELTTERKVLIIKELGDVLWYVSAICNELGISMAYVAKENLKKLKDRTDRQVLQGSGDER